ncbi:hypothetical protein GUITHDRAFT_161264 [Guillardia theta CCMP2712]|uniref:Uncharacterized protein n=1 Tax=Guillardia theta (strain CCMP2712) TaxID=905079 RepID=L1JVV2_GUITC|nr:hypothetical protein GUITHDRAFT_161264 [Guillardia theta CCMP2712]EKX52711.1 hypothetical protein GUITHDRAFT_161264 [Guillardia theta CCMP2712]|eukprot:XP_005839691.1 hypothetical protein GUITHDRAFT_161264 [Guillardia theta CCMP2712]
MRALAMAMAGSVHWFALALALALVCVRGETRSWSSKESSLHQGRMLAGARCRTLCLRGGHGGQLQTAVVYIYGTPEEPTTQESRELVGILRDHGIEYTSHDVGADPLLMSRIAREVQWKSFPQLHINGRLVGDHSIVKVSDATRTSNTMNEDLDSNDLVSENELMPDESLRQQQPNQPKAGDASNCNPTRKKKACKNCTCGLAKQQAEDGATEAPKSACGNCYLGDAFRCDGCPYKGMPPFKPGEKQYMHTNG